MPQVKLSAAKVEEARACEQRERQHRAQAQQLQAAEEEQARRLDALRGTAAQLQQLVDSVEAGEAAGDTVRCVCLLIQRGVQKETISLSDCFSSTRVSRPLSEKAKKSASTCSADSGKGSPG